MERFEPVEHPSGDQSVKNRNCRICGGKLSGPLLVREMMFGTREEFSYLTCENCGCLQIAQIPADLFKYYGEQYYSYGEAPKNFSKMRLNRNNFKYWTRRLLGHIRCLSSPPRNVFHLLGVLGIRRDDRILDVGSGAGGLVNEIRASGFMGVLGIDPFLSADTRDLNGAIIAKKASIFDVDAAWRLIMFNHSFEHMDCQYEVLQRCRQILAKNGWLVIRIPTVSSYAFRLYGSDWVQLDAPRHLYLHSRASIRHLAEKSGFKLVHMWDDSGALQFIGSEQYRHDIPLMDPRSQIINRDESIFSQQEIRKFKNMANDLNRIGDGDQFCAVLRAV